MTGTDLKWFIEEIKYLHRSSQQTNAHTMEHSVMLGHYDVVVFGLGRTIKLLIYQDTDTDRLHPVVRFEWMRYPSVTALQVLLTIWDFCKEEH